MYVFSVIYTEKFTTGEGGLELTTEEMECLVEKHMASVFQFCCYLTGNREEGEELCQETFLKAVEMRRKIHVRDEDGRSARNYFIGIAVNLWRNERRKQGRRQRIAPMVPWAEDAMERISDAADLEDTVIHKEMLREVQEQIQTLPDAQRIVVNMYYSAQMGVSDIARILHLPKETVKSRLRLAKGKIRKGMEVKGYEC